MNIENTEIIRFHFSRRDGVPALAPQVMSYVDITFCIEGEMTYVIDGERVVLSASDAIVIPAGIKRERLEGGLPNYYASLNLIMPTGRITGISGVVRAAVDADVIFVLKLLWKCYTGTDSHRVEKCRGLVDYLCSRLAEASEGSESPYVKRVERMIAEAPNKKFTLTALADSVHLTPQYLCSLFKRHTGMTIVGYITSRRIEYAKRLILTKRGISLSQVAEMCGFSDYYAFSHAFRRLEGISASGYKREFGIKAAPAAKPKQ